MSIVLGRSRAKMALHPLLAEKLARTPVLIYERRLSIEVISFISINAALWTDWSIGDVVDSDYGSFIDAVSCTYYWTCSLVRIIMHVIDVTDCSEYGS